MNPHAPHDEPYLGYYPDAELVFAIVCPLGTDHRKVVDTMINYLKQFGYVENRIHLTDLFPELLAKIDEVWSPPADNAEMARYKIAIGNKIRSEKRPRRLDFGVDGCEFNCCTAFSNSGGIRGASLRKTAHIITTLKRPEEVRTLQKDLR